MELLASLRAPSPAPTPFRCEHHQTRGEMTRLSSPPGGHERRTSIPSRVTLEIPFGDFPGTPLSIFLSDHPQTKGDSGHTCWQLFSREDGALAFENPPSNPVGEARHAPWNVADRKGKTRSQETGESRNKKTTLGRTVVQGVTRSIFQKCSHGLKKGRATTSLDAVKRRASALLLLLSGNGGASSDPAAVPAAVI